MNHHDLPATLTVQQTSKLIGLSVRATYRAIEAGHIAVIRFGRRIVVPTAPLLRLLGVPNADSGRPDPSTNGDAEADSSGTGGPTAEPNPSEEQGR